MKLTTNSFSAKLYRWFYQTMQMPKTLCPYFWKLVIAWIFALPVAILTIPAFVIFRDDDPGDNSQGTRIFGSLIIYGCLFCAIVLLFSISAIWYWFPKNSMFYDWQIGGIVGWCASALVGTGAGIRYLFTQIKNRKKKPKAKEESNIVVEFVKAKYNKYCPKIDWQ